MPYAIFLFSLDFLISFVTDFETVWTNENLVSSRSWQEKACMESLRCELFRKE